MFQNVLKSTALKLHHLDYSKLGSYRKLIPLFLIFDICFPKQRWLICSKKSTSKTRASAKACQSRLSAKSPVRIKDPINKQINWCGGKRWIFDGKINLFLLLEFLTIDCTPVKIITFKKNVYYILDVWDYFRIEMKNGTTFQNINQDFCWKTFLLSNRCERLFSKSEKRKFFFFILVRNFIIITSAMKRKKSWNIIKSILQGIISQ